MKWRRRILWVIAIGAALVAVGSGILTGFQTRAMASALERQMEAADLLARAIPRDCPEDAAQDRREADHWSGLVEGRKTETAQWLGPEFADDQDDYPHQCRVEWVRERLKYFRGNLRIAALALRARARP